MWEKGLSATLTRKHKAHYFGGVNFVDADLKLDFVKKGSCKQTCRDQIQKRLGVADIGLHKPAICFWLTTPVFSNMAICPAQARLVIGLSQGWGMSCLWAI